MTAPDPTDPAREPPSGNPGGNPGGNPRGKSVEQDRFARLCELFEVASALGADEREGFLAAIEDAELRKSLAGMLDADRTGAPQVRTLVDVGAVLDEREAALRATEAGRIVERMWDYLTAGDHESSFTQSPMENA